MSNEIFPPTEEELTRIIQSLELRLQDYSYQDEWVQIHEELLKKRNELQELTIKNNAL
ncbi:hypothetical protein [Chryseobacterium sp. KCF3-3]|uniref:hypothetical protein n=1 Tax=Chryseobacterium sp. KCF3-3 TaxID=3231511 RepID=UPI0038B2D885